jgi:hypothetical protein
MKLDVISEHQPSLAIQNKSDIIGIHTLIGPFNFSYMNFKRADGNFLKDRTQIYIGFKLSQ